MPNRNALLGLVEFIGQPEEPFDPRNSDTGVPIDPAEKRVPIRIGTNTDWRMAYLDPNHERYQFWRSMLTRLQALSMPISLEVEPASRGLMALRLPIVTRVISVTSIDNGAWIVLLDRSSTLHMAYETGENAMAVLNELRRLAGTAQDVVVTVDRERNRIIDVDPLPPNVEVKRGDPIVLVNRSLSSLVNVVSEIDEGDLDGFYASLRSQKCDLAAVSDSCLPVQWADDHCFGMADHMCEELAKPPLSLEAGKVWLHGKPDGLRMKSRNAPECSYSWRYHVAAFVLVRGLKGDGAVRVIDPAACLNGPLTLQAWRHKVSGHEETLDFTPRRVFEQFAPGEFVLRPDDEPEFSINKIRDELKDRLEDHHGAAPPFATCPADGPCP